MYKHTYIKPFALTLILCIIVGIQQMIAQGVKEKTIDKLEKTATDYNQKIDKQTAKYLQKLERQEQKFKRKLQRIDSTAAKQLFAQSQEKYQ